MRGAPLWQKLIWAVLFLLVYEGALRKWVVPGLQSQIYFAKDLILIAAYILFLGSSRHHGSHLKAMATLKMLVLLSLAYFLIELLNPNSPSMLVSIAGFKNYLLYAPLAFIVPYMFVSAEDLEHKLRTYAILMAPCVALGLVQFAFPPTHWLNGYLNNQDSDAPQALMMGAVFGSGIEQVRSIGTFSYIGGYTAFLTVMFYVAAGLAAKNRFKFSGNTLVIGYLVLTVAAMFTTGSRGPIWWLVATWPLALVIWRSGRTPFDGNRWADAVGGPSGLAIGAIHGGRRVRCLRRSVGPGRGYSRSYAITLGPDVGRSRSERCDWHGHGYDQRRRAKSYAHC